MLHQAGHGVRLVFFLDHIIEWRDYVGGRKYMMQHAVSGNVYELSSSAFFLANCL